MGEHKQEKLTLLKENPLVNQVALKCKVVVLKPKVKGTSALR